jgi:ABC-type multidrug transport system fused ATPase/permease subunit
MSWFQELIRVRLINDEELLEEGTYEKLMAQGGVFVDLVARQRIDSEPAADNTN